MNTLRIWNLNIWYNTVQNTPMTAEPLLGGCEPWWGAGGGEVKAVRMEGVYCEVDDQKQRVGHTTPNSASAGLWLTGECHCCHCEGAKEKAEQLST